MCLTCHHSFTRRTLQTVRLTDFRAFYSFVMGNKNRLQSSRDRQLSRKSLSKIFQAFFTHPLSPEEVSQVFPLTQVADWVLALDGTWLRRSGVIMIYGNHTTKEILHWSWESGETYVAIANGLVAATQLMGESNLPSGVVSDWKGSIVSGVERYIGQVPHQRCLAHVKRDIESVCPKHSPYQATLVLRRLGQLLIQINTHEEKQQWLQLLAKWYAMYGSLLTERSVPEIATRTKRTWWYTHSNLRRAYRILTKDQDHLFAHLDYSWLPKTNNGLEGINSDIKTKLKNHRGMKPQQQYQFVSWYLTFKKVKDPCDLKRLWDMWKRRL